MDKLIRPVWAKKAKVEMAKRDLNQRQLGEEIGVDPTNVSKVLRGMLVSPTISQKICDFLNIER